MTSVKAGILREQLAQVDAQTPEAVLKRIVAANNELEAAEARPGLAIGAQAPEFSLPNATGQPVSLSSRLAAGPVVLVFYRGSWCPYCDLQLRAYARMLPELTRLNARLVAISPQQPAVEVPNVSEHRELGFPLLFDSQNAVARRYALIYPVDELMRTVLSGFGLDLATINGSEQWELPVPATFVVTDGLQIRWSHVEADYRLRAEPDDILRALRTL